MAQISNKIYFGQFLVTPQVCPEGRFAHSAARLISHSGLSYYTSLVRFSQYQAAASRPCPRVPPEGYPKIC